MQKNNYMEVTNKKTFDKANIFKQGDFNQMYEKYFTGKSYLNPLTKTVHASNVTFEPACRNNWHIHTAKSGGGQVLFCIAGEGWYQEWGKEPISLVAGDVVEIATGVKHWHGAKKDSWFSHISLEAPGIEGSTKWLEEVTKDEYDKLPGAANLLKMEKQTAGRTKLGDFAPKFAYLNDDVLFGEVWANTAELSPRDRSLITVSALVGAGITDNSLKAHLSMAKAHGVTKGEMIGLLTQLAFYAGWPRAWAVFPMAKEVYEKQKE